MDRLSEAKTAQGWRVSLALIKSGKWHGLNLQGISIKCLPDTRALPQLEAYLQFQLLEDDTTSLSLVRYDTLTTLPLSVTHYHAVVAAANNVGLKTNGAGGMIMVIILADGSMIFANQFEPHRVSTLERELYDLSTALLGEVHPNIFLLLGQ